MVRRWSVQTRVVSLAFVSLALGACDPYVRFVGDSNAGAVDPVNFPAEYLGTDGDGKKPGMGVMMPVAASVADEAVGYYLFPFTAPDLSLSIQGELLAPVDYQFDEDGGSRCTAPESYVFDQQRDAVRYDEQGNIFTMLPDAEGYLPVVAEVVVHSSGLPCQDVKSEARLVERSDVMLELVPPKNPQLEGSHPTGKPSGRFFARPIIDPSIDVRLPDGSVDANTGLGPQKWGWYQRYLLAYLDGGEVPTFDRMVQDAQGGRQLVTEMVPQAIYFPLQHPGDDGTGNTVAVDGALGDGFDILSAVRGKSGASPLCEVFSFIPKDPLAPETSVKAIDMSSAQPTGQYVWCIQVTQ